jgi:hypothetical protein
MPFKSIVTTALLSFPKNSYTLAGLDPGSSILQADAMTIAPRRHAWATQLFLVFGADIQLLSRRGPFLTLPLAPRSEMCPLFDGKICDN